MRSLAFILISLVLAGCRAPETRETAPAHPGAPIFLIVIDTLRADHLPAYGYDRVETPHLDAFRADSVLFRRAYTHVPMTLPAHVSLLTGKLPNEHGVRNNLGFQFDGSAVPTLPGVLKEKGYATGAAVSSYVLRHETGLGAIFDFYEDSIAPPPGAAFDDYERNGSDTAALAIDWIRANRQRPIFFMLHLYEPHTPYEPPEPYRDRYAAAPYDGEIAAVDAIVGSFIEELKALDLYDEATVIVTSDHGEGLGDHGEDQHSILLYRGMIEVPLIVKLPRGARRGETIDAPVQLADIPPTLAAIAGAGELAPTASARNLFGPIDAGERALYAETLYPKLHFGWSELRSLIRGPHHYIESPRPELYDMVADPAEGNNVIADERRLASAFRNDLAAMPRGDETPGAVDPETAERLAALGYIGRPRTFDSGAELMNPAEEIGFLDQIRKAFELASSGPADEAEEALRAVLAKNAGVPEVRMRLAELLANEGRIDEALEEYRRAIDTAGMALPDLYLNAANLYLRKGDFVEAESHARLALSALPDRTHETLGRIAMKKGDLGTAEREAGLAVESASMPSAMLLTAEIAAQRGEYEKALSILDRTEARVAELRLGALFRLQFVRADTLARMGRMSEAPALFQREIDTFPANVDAYASLAVVQHLLGDSAAAESTLRALVENNPSARAREIAQRTRTTIR